MRTDLFRFIATAAPRQALHPARGVAALVLLAALVPAAPASNARASEETAIAIDETSVDSWPAAAAALCGDANDDGELGAIDALVTLRVSVGTGSCPLERCDVTNDGAITANDAVRILRKSVGQNVVLLCPGTTTTTTTTLPPVSMTWKVTDACPDGSGVSLRLFDVDHDVTYPSPSQVFTVGSGAAGNFPIQCRNGATICFGAEDAGDGVVAWGAGIDGNRICNSCCSTCTEGASRTVSLGCGQVEWTLKDSCYDDSGMQFRLFDVDNGLVSPRDPGGVWILGGDDVARTVAVACIPGAKVCFGAQKRPPTAAYWGVGIDGDKGCQNCCRICPASGVEDASANLTCN